MNRFFRAICAATISAAALIGTAQAQEQTFSQPYWVTRPVIETIGMATVEFAPNRATFSVTYLAVENTAERATRAAADNARRGEQAIRATVSESVRISSQLSLEPLYEQYRDREGNRIDNTRPDQISSYAARVTLQVSIDNQGNLDSAATARAAAMAAGPEVTTPLNFFLVPTAEMRRQVYADAVADAHGRARAAAAATGQTLGDLLVVQDGRGPCLGQWTELPSGVRGPAPVAAPPPPRSRLAGNEEIIVTASRSQPAITTEDIAALNLPSEPAPIQLQTNVCLIYALQ